MLSFLKESGGDPFFLPDFSNEPGFPDRIGKPVCSVQPLPLLLLSREAELKDPLASPDFCEMQPWSYRSSISPWQRQTRSGWYPEVHPVLGGKAVEGQRFLAVLGQAPVAFGYFGSAGLDRGDHRDHDPDDRLPIFPAALNGVFATKGIIEEQKSNYLADFRQFAAIGKKR